MILRALAILPFGVGVAHAQTARVVSGEHEEFTRLVVELPAPADWTVGRLALGYGFAAAGKDQPGYDLSRVWDRIPRTRLQALRVDPADGVLRLTLACDCHLFPFEYQPGMIVLDIKDGPPPPGSIFEVPLTLASPSTSPVQAAVSVYDWLSARANAADKVAADLKLPTGSTSLASLRDELLAQISRGAAEGIVDMALPGKPPDHPDMQWGELPWTTIRLGEGSGVEIRPGDTNRLPSSGGECFPDEQLDIAGWGTGATPSELLSEARGNLFGEFDRVTKDSVLRAVQVHLYLGFGAEARGYADLLEEDAPDSLAFYRSMAHLVDGEEHATSPFAGMLGCDGAAALWAAMALDHLPQAPDVNGDAILRNFVALPPHLRRHLGPALAEKFLALKDAESARIIRDAIARTPQADPASVALLDVQSSLNAGESSTAQSLAETAVAADPDDGRRLIALVEAHFQDGTPLDPEVPLTLRTLLREAEGRGDEPDLRRALVLALALSGDVDAAFDVADGQPQVALDLWRVVSLRASDDAFLTHAVLSDSVAVPPVDTVIAEGIALRLLQLGFADAALTWLGPTDLGDSADRRRLAAEAELGRGDAHSAVRLLVGIDDPLAEELRARALIQLGDLVPAMVAFRDAGSIDKADRVLTWTRDWAGVSGLAEGVWSNAAQAVNVETPAGDLGLLGQGARLVDESAAARDAVAALLSSVPPPVE